MIGNIKRKIIKFIENNGFERRVIVEGKILNQTYKVRKYTIRNKPDNDDAWLFELTKNIDSIFDIGANIGQSAILTLTNNLEKIVLIDPNPRALSIAAENVISNNLGHKAIFYTGFVSSEPGEEVDFYTVGAGAAGSKFKSFAKTASKLKSHYKVKTLTVDQVSNETAILPDLIKIDVEGAEIEVLRGAKTVASKGKTQFFVEVHSGEELSIINNTEQIINWCKENNYTPYYLKKMSVLTTDDIKSRGRYHALLIPKGANLPENLIQIKEFDALK